MNQRTDAAVFILLGQSNAVGHAVPMSEEDKIKIPLKNVFGLSREDNQSFDITELKWSGYKSAGMNIAEEQDDTYSLANCLAKLWQSEIDSGNKRNLPDLYIVHIAIGAQGVTKGYMWNPAYPKRLVPGKLGTVNIALALFTNHILSLLKDSFDKMGKNFKVFGIHWRGNENDMLASWDELKEKLKSTNKEIFESFLKSINKDAPVILHRIVCPDRCMDLDPSGETLEKMEYINKIFRELSGENENISLFDARKIPWFDSDVRGNGIFKEDMVHYTPEANKWVAEEIFNEYKK